MNLQRLSQENSHLFNKAFALYESAFPREERRDQAETDRVLQNPDYHMDFIMEEDRFLGVMLYWETEDFIYLEHFTTLPEVRNHGVGSRALKLLQEKGKPVLLEIEPPEDELTQRRYGFYRRNGFVMNPHYHIQAKYHLGDPDLELKILSFPQVLPRELYLAFLQYMHRNIGIQPNFSLDVTVRPMEAQDDPLQVAKLIYLSDAYIYPNWFDSEEEGIRVLSKMIDLPTLYNRENITVAVTASGFVAGAMVSKDCPIAEEEAHLYEAFRQAGVSWDERTHQIYLDYYDKMRDPEGHYIANIAVDPAYQGQGICSKLMHQRLQDEKLCHLECVQKNSGAWRVYQRLGFVVTKEYPGVFDVPCFKMVRYGKG